MTTLPELKVPYALDEAGAVVAANSAPQKGRYTCLDCRQPLTLRRRPGARPHFTHHGHALRRCSGESATHKAAKAILRHQIEQELREQQRVTWHLACSGAGDHPCRERITFPQHHPVPAWDAVLLEVAHGAHRFDVAITANGRVVFGFEIYFKHAVPEEKARRLDVPWLELLAEDILAYRPRLPHPDRHSQDRCPACKTHYARLTERQSDDQARRQVSAEFAAESHRIRQTWQAIQRTVKQRAWKR
mgnify:CR=1 FL=1